MNDKPTAQADLIYRAHIARLCELIVTRLHAEGLTDDKGTLYGNQPARRKECDLLALNIGIAYEQALIDHRLRETISPFVGFGIATRGYSYVQETLRINKEQAST